MNRESPEEAGQGERKTQGEVTGQGRPGLLKMVQSAEGGKGRDESERIIVAARSPYQENHPADAHTSSHKSVLELANPAWTRSVHLVNGTGSSLSLGQPTADKSSGGSVDTTKMRSNYRGSQCARARGQ